MIYNIYTDGGARGNPGPGAIGVVALDEQLKVIHKFGKTIGQATNNIAEYTAVKEALLWLKNCQQPTANSQQPTINFYLDSLLVVSQLSGHYKIKEPKLKKLFGDIQLLIVELGLRVSFSHIPRGKNHLADLEVNKALDKEFYG